MLFTLSRYKFAAKMLPADKSTKVLELGCQEGLGTIMLAECGQQVLGLDFDKEAILYAQKNLKHNNITFRCADFIGKKYGKFRSVVSLDVIEHIRPELEDRFLKTICLNLDKNGFALIGTPNITTDKYASKYSRLGHVNLFSPERLDRLLRKYFDNVFIFGMNDEVIHTGFYPMCHYIMALGSGLKKAAR
ncbi:MAG: class I SAM-dependent methyltransferase [Candidatus Omnitrophica bacterium]|nr:class I SAM-dependent methyltransferase [Candidatus Omnitrophota bacterium]